MNTLVYFRELDEFSRSYLVTGNHNTFNPTAVEKKYEAIKFQIANMLLRHHGVAFRVYGENIPLAVLINIFGIRGVEALLEQGAIQFVLWTSMVTYLVDDVPGVNPLQSGFLTSSVHCDPEESATAGLKWMKDELPRRVRRNLLRKVTKTYKTIPRSIAEDAARFGHEGYNDNLFESLGLPKAKDIEQLNKKEREKLAGFAEQCLELTFLSLNHYDSLDSYNIATLNRAEFRHLRDSNIISELMDVLFKIEKVPNFDEMVSSGLINITDIPQIRANRDSIRFREWISRISEEVDAESVAKEYISSIVGSSSKLDGGVGKFMRTTAVLSLSAIAGLKLPVMPSIAVSSAIGLLDSYLISAVTKGWSPRYFFDKDIKRILKHQSKKEHSN